MSSPTQSHAVPWDRQTVPSRPTSLVGGTVGLGTSCAAASVAADLGRTP